MVIIPMFKVLFSLIKLWENNEEVRSKHKFNMSHPDYLREFSTISLDMGRGSGKTTTVKAMLELIHNSYVISNEMHYKRHLNPNRLGDVTIDEYSTVFVDEPYKLFQTITEDDFYSYMAFHKVGLIIMLGQK